MQRDAVAALVDRGDDRAGSRQATAEDQRRHERRLVVGQRLEARLLGEPLAEQPRPPLSMEGAERKLIEHDRRQAAAADDPVRCARARRRPRRSTRRPTADPRRRAMSAGRWRRRSAARRRARGSVANPASRRHLPPWIVSKASPRPSNPPGRSWSARGRAPKPAEPGGPAGPDRPWPAGTRQPRPWPGSPEAGGSSDAGLAGQQEQVTATRGSLRDAPVGQVQQVVASDEERAQERADGAHWRQV